MNRRLSESFYTYPYHGQKIIKALNERLENQVWLANRCDVSPSMINHIIKGKSIPSLSLALRIAANLDDTVDNLFGDIK